MSYKFLDKYDYLTPLSVMSMESNLISDSLNFKRKVVRKNAQRFDFTITISGGRNQSLNGDLFAHWMKYGMDSGFEIDVPQPFHTLASFSVPSQAIVTVALPVAAGSKTVTINSDYPFVIPAGRFFRFKNHNKLYVLTESASSVQVSASQYSAELAFAPGLTETVAGGTLLELNDVKAFVLNEADNAVITYESGVIQSATLRFVEKL